MRWVLAIVLLTCLLACHQTTPKVNAGSLEEGESLVVGEAISMEVVWNRKCRKTRKQGQSMLWGLIGKRPLVIDVPCDSRPFRVAVKCSIRCELRGADAVITGPATFEIRTLEVGTLDMQLTTTLDDNSNSETYQGSVSVIAPTAIDLSCNDAGASYKPCDGGIAAARPLLVPLVRNGARAVKSALLTANGRPVTGAIDLATLFPEAAAAGGGVKPGTYSVTLAIGDAKRTWELQAR